jgi:hypothetical protein
VGGPDKYLLIGLFMDETPVLNVAMDESTIVTLGIIVSVGIWAWVIWLMKRSGWRPLVWVVAIVVARQLIFYARWIVYSRRADKIADFIAKADRYRRMPIAGLVGDKRNQD